MRDMGDMGDMEDMPTVTLAASLISRSPSRCRHVKGGELRTQIGRRVHSPYEIGTVPIFAAIFHHFSRPIDESIRKLVVPSQGRLRMSGGLYGGMTQIYLY